jgi:light-regulated signal transduction histidine kinase (bacteriophytochrome)
VEFIIGTSLRAEGDPAMLHWVLSILLGNAWKFTETVPRGRIEFEALPGTDGIRGFIVSDNRAGLAPNGGHGLLRAFHRLHATRDFSSPGQAMVKRIIQRHGGRAGAEIDLRQKARFYFTPPPPGQGSAAQPCGKDQPDSLTGSP